MSPNHFLKKEETPHSKKLENENIRETERGPASLGNKKSDSKSEKFSAN
jgi:hypothetical protein